MVRRIWVPIALASMVASCEGMNGDDRLRRSTVTYSAADDGFAVEYVQPPWEEVLADEESLELRVPAELFGVPLDGSDPTHVFQIAYVDAHSKLDELTEQAGTVEGLDTDGLDTDGLDPDGLPPGASIPDGVEGPIPDYLLSIDLREPGAVALAELDHLLVEQKANLDEPLEPFLTDSRRGGLVYQVVLEPGVFVRVYYFPARRAVVRAAFVSIFDLGTSDIDAMARKIHTGGEDAP